MRLRSILVAVTALLVVTSVGGLAVQDGTQTDPTELDSCTSITEPGRYVLTQDIESDGDVCIEITADDVVLVGDGHMIDGGVTDRRFEAFVNATNETGTFPTDQEWARIGISANASSPLSNVTVRDVTTTGWFFGIYYDNVTDGTIRNVNASGNGDGISVYNSEDVTVRGSVASGNNGAGIIVDNPVGGPDVVSTNNAIVGNQFSSNFLDGVAIFETTNSIVQANEIADNRYGVTLGFVANDNRITNNSIEGSTVNAIDVFDSQRNSFSNNEITNPTNVAETQAPIAIQLDNASDTAFRGTTVQNSVNWTLVSFNDSTATADQFTIDGTSVSFESRDVALGVDIEDAENQTLSQAQVVVTNTSVNSTIDLTVAWSDANESRFGEPSETTATSNESQLDSHQATAVFVDYPHRSNVWRGE